MIIKRISALLTVFALAVTLCSCVGVTEEDLSAAESSVREFGECLKNQDFDGMIDLCGNKEEAQSLADEFREIIPDSDFILQALDTEDGELVRELFGTDNLTAVANDVVNYVFSKTEITVLEAKRKERTINQISVKAVISCLDAEDFESKSSQLDENTATSAILSAVGTDDPTALLEKYKERTGMTNSQIANKFSGMDEEKIGMEVMKAFAPELTEAYKILLRQMIDSSDTSSVTCDFTLQKIDESWKIINITEE